MTWFSTLTRRSDEGSSEYLRNSCREAPLQEQTTQANVTLLLS